MPQSTTPSRIDFPQFMFPIPEPRAPTIDALLQDWQGRLMYMFSPFPLLSKVTQEGEVILIASWWSSRPWFPHLLPLCLDHPFIIPYRRDLLSQQVYVSDGKSYQAAGFSKEVSRLTAAPRRPSRNRMYNDRWLHFAHWAAGQRIDLLGPTAAQIAAFLYYLFDTRGLSPQTTKGYWSCLASILSGTGNAAAVQA